VAADVVKGADLLVLAFDHDHRRLGGVDLLREIAADTRYFLHAADIQPRAFEDGLTFEFIELR
jgi:hypothetical protein